MGGHKTGDGSGEVEDGPGHSPDGTGVDRRQRPMETDRSRYFETGQLNVAEGPPGVLPTILGGNPSEQEPGLRLDNFVCNGAPGREPCRYYAAVLTPADGVARGFGAMRQIRRFCLKLATGTELWELDGDLFACTLRDPRDSTSAGEIQAFEDRQRDLASEMAEKSGHLDF
jgi:hypothetical protein